MLPSARIWITVSSLLIAFHTPGCDLSLFPHGEIIEGRLTPMFGCLGLISPEGKQYEVYFRSDDLVVPPLGAYVRLQVEPIKEGASVCMFGTMVSVIKVLNVFVDFRTEPVVGNETWGPADEPLVLGKVTVQEGARLTVLPGTTIQIIPEGELRIRGSLAMEGSVTDSVRIIAAEGHERPYDGGPGPLVLDSTAGECTIRYVNIPTTSVSGTDRAIERMSGSSVSVTQGDLTIRQSTIEMVTGDASTIALYDNALVNVMAVHTSVLAERNRFSRQLTLSYSTAVARNNLFVGQLSYVTFHGASGGLLEHNTFRDGEKAIELRHTSSPRLVGNNFLNPGTVIECNTFQGTTCVDATNNWWEAVTEDQIRAKIAGTCVCYSPWLAAPDPQAPP